MLQIIIFISLLTTTTYCNWSSNWEDEFEHFVFLDSPKYFKIYWTQHDNDTITFGMQVNSTGWVALGISDKGQMPGSDISFGWIDDNDGKVYLQDRYASSRSRPIYDSEQNLELLDGEQIEGSTRIKFRRDNFLCNEHDKSIEEGTTKLIFAWNNNDPIYDDEYSIFPHEACCMGSKSINLHQKVSEIELDFDNLDFFDIKMNDFLIPSDTVSTYYCKTFILPNLNHIQHIVMYEPLIPSKSNGITHHMIIYKCDPSVWNHTLHSDYHAFCFSDPNMPPCAGGQLMAWAIGGGAVYFPEHTGLPFGGLVEDDGTFIYGFIEIHYENAQYVKNVLDNSGIRIWYTSELRANGLNLVGIGNAVHPYFFIPPHMNSIIHYAYCRSECTEIGFPDQGLKVIATLLHAHTAAYAMRLRHIRNGKELKIIAEDWNFDFNYQSWIVLDFEHEITLLKGDEFIVECYYNTTNRDHITFGGEATADEMCAAALLVYPQTDLVICGSLHTISEMDRWSNMAVEKGYIEAKDVYLNLAEPYALNPEYVYANWTADINNNTKCAYLWYNEFIYGNNFLERYLMCKSRQGPQLLEGYCTKTDEFYDTTKMCIVDKIKESDFVSYNESDINKCSIESRPTINIAFEETWDSAYCNYNVKYYGECSVFINEFNEMLLVFNFVAAFSVFAACCYLRRKFIYSKIRIITGKSIEYNDEFKHDTSNNNVNDNNEDILINLSWRNITYSISKKKETKIILNNVSGDVSSGELTAILGPSGSGKTTLLNILSKHLVKTKHNELNGRILINNMDRCYLKKHSFSNMVGYVQQENMLYDQQTVYETLMTAAQFDVKIKTEMQKKQMVENILGELNLLHIRNSKVGDIAIKRGISGGERKRLNIAVEMIRKPLLLFADEPTSGLDSNQALKVIESLKKLKCTVIISIHQPRSKIFQLFDNIILLAPNGKIIYNGSTKLSIQYFANKGYQCPSYFNPADYFTDLISNESSTKVNILADEFKQQFDVYVSDANLASNSTFHPNYVSNSICRTLSILLKRSCSQYLRDKRSMIVRIITNVAIPLFLALVYAEINGNVINTQSVLFLTAYTMISGPITTCESILFEKNITNSEIRKGSYSMLLYYIVKTLTETVLQLPFAVIFGGIIYWIVGLRNNILSFLYFECVAMLTSSCAIVLGLLCHAISPTITISRFLIFSLHGFLFLFSGFAVQITHLPAYLRWIATITLSRWTFASFCVNEFKNDKFECNSDNIMECLLKGETKLSILELDIYTASFTLLMILILFIAHNILLLIALMLNRIHFMDVPDPIHDEIQLELEMHMFSDTQATGKKISPDSIIITNEDDDDDQALSK